MALGKKAYYVDPNSDDPALREGVDLPRCTARPGKNDVDPRPGVDLGVGRWECALPKGHEQFETARHQPHSWAQVS